METSANEGVLQAGAGREGAAVEAGRAFEIVVRWADSVLSTAHRPAKGTLFASGPTRRPNADDVALPPAFLDEGERLPLLACAGGLARALPLPGARASVVGEGGRASPWSEAEAAQGVALAPGQAVRYEAGALAVEVRLVEAAERLPKAARLGLGLASGVVALSALAHVLLLGSMAYLRPTLGAVDDEDARRELLYRLQALSRANAEVEAPKDATAGDAGDGREGSPGARAKGPEGLAGVPKAAPSDRRLSARGPEDNASPRLPTREQQLEEARHFGTAGLLQDMARTDTFVALWTDPDAQGRDAKTHYGHLFGPEAGDAFGFNGLGLRGTGAGGDGKNESIGLGNIGTWGGVTGTCGGPDCGAGGRRGNGTSVGLTVGSHKTRAPRLTPVGATVVGGRLAPETVQRIVRQNFGRFRMCYENGLKVNPSLQGRVAVRFVIGRDGAVASVANGGSDLPDAGVVSCVVRSFGSLSFPQPEGGVVTVVYPLTLTPGD
ncbi:MAG TPA: AgmX/PglI C-terminal domain-containing protein [Polyangiaceae bacterium]|nr:AgmX/PglI C-terminal domain-containing protein [Polyangiaceae bacterium]